MEGKDKLTGEKVIVEQVERCCATCRHGDMYAELGGDCALLLGNSQEKLIVRYDQVCCKWTRREPK